MLNTKEKLLFVWPVLLIIGLSVAWKAANRTDNLHSELRALAGDEAIDCGVGSMKKIDWVMVSDDRAKADACSVKAFRGKQPFFVRYDVEVENGFIDKSIGIVRTPQRELIFTTLEYYPQWYGQSTISTQMSCNAPGLSDYVAANGQRWKRVNCLMPTCSISVS